MNKIMKTKKKKESLFLKVADVLDDMLYLGVNDKEEHYNKLRYSLELNPLLKGNEDDVDFVVASFRSMIERIENVE